ncbi:nSTAND1 domain-containing NTPase [Microseira wollei]|uniref:Novel STAND NTPase 1 domain-containing protein n=1 Tax=Microseira wollei NIES-4236 TaxID=2530354 RepID=A0AAV3XN62_9CYAN|nr:AAA-like domain-containing protein [Microseira wollei]GET43036.1 hypothetical protein MiSe_78560 [Microseira wollei NIES-4236]
MTSQLGAPCPFLAGPMIEKPQHFVGREAELDYITSRIMGIGSSSINVVGKQGMGKSSLLYRFCQTYEQRVENPRRFIVIYLNLQESHCRRENAFYLAAARQLLNHPLVKAKPELMRPWKNIKFLDRQSFSGAIGEWKRQGLFPVLCLDDFEALFRYPKHFNDGFFDNLRFLINSNILRLVVASHRKLDFYQRRYKLTSSFLNGFEQVLPLGELTEEEAWELVSLPERMGAKAALSTEEQHLAREWGGGHPFLLQLAASLLWEAHQQGLDVSWAQAKFEQVARRIPKPLWKIPPYLDEFVRSYGSVGMVILLVLFGIGVLHQTQVFGLLQK